MMLFDTHAHVTDKAFDADRDNLLEMLPQQGIRYLMAPAWNLESAYAVDALSKKYDYIYGAVGSHPDAANEVGDDVLDAYCALCRKNPKIRAIGEIGLDYHYEDVPRDIQKRSFQKQLELASELALPAIVHERDAHEDGMTMIRMFPSVRGVFHCYSGSLEMARALIELGWYIGFTGVLTFKNAKKAVQIAREIPLDRIVIETDCPYMAPEPFRGTRNDPSKLYRMAEKLAEIRGMHVHEIQVLTTENAKRLYAIE